MGIEISKNDLEYMVRQSTILECIHAVMSIQETYPSKGEMVAHILHCMCEEAAL